MLFRQTRIELAKIWKNRAFLFSFVTLLFINLFLLWGQSQNEAIPPSAYKQFSIYTHSMSMEELERYISEKHEEISAVVTIDRAQREMASGILSADALRRTYGDLYDKYYPLYQSGAFLDFTDDANSEYRLIDGIYAEFTQIQGYNTFRDSIDEKAKQISSVSIFAQDDTFISRNLLKTQQDYAAMGDVDIYYAPQKGLRYAVNFYLSDLVAVVVIVFLAFTSLRYERDKGLLKLIRSTAGGHIRTSFSKLLAMSVSAFAVIAGIYIVNILFSELTFGIGPLSRSIQSNPFLMRSTLSVNVFQYLCAFVFTKWLALTVVGSWILLMALLPRRAAAGYVGAIVFPVVSELIRLAIPFTSSLNLIRYINIASLMQTNEILGSYLNLNILEQPVNIVVVEVLSGIFYLALFSALFTVAFSKSSLTVKEKSVWFSKKRKKMLPNLLAQESYKFFIMNAGIFVLLSLVGFQLYLSFNTESYISPREIYLKNYMDVLEGEINNEKIDFLNEEYEHYKPIIKLEQALQSGTITQSAYDSQITKYYSEIEKYNVFKEIYEKVRQSLTEGKPISFIYDSGYTQFWGFKSDQNLVECLLACLSASIIFSPVFAMEKSSGMINIISVTPLGKRHILKTKLFISLFCSVVIACSSLLNKFIVMIRDYSFSSVGLPLSILPEFSKGEYQIPVIMLILLNCVVRVISCLGISMVVLVISAKVPNAMTATILSIIMLCLPLLLALYGQGAAGFLSFYPLFHFPVLLASFDLVTVAWIYLILCTMFVLFGYQYLFSRKDISETTLDRKTQFLLYE